ncbi:hypothetical protein TNIN_338981 [Trichonephila inaurata madagascariensis]|uniref:Uncharacterized protein n=1 Tax=Trichonephila inaurata madagascariensis TaxID=2747483 RepID=A0A8X6JZ27_9ARAC|nr:hypothetical protein TNIN_338981 [Trichonephila inaurata madagascariensis]
MELEDNPPRVSIPKLYVKPAPPITIDNVQFTGHLLKKLQDLTKSKIVGRFAGKSLRVYPETPVVYNTIRRFIDDNKMEAYTFHLREDKVIMRGMPADMPPEEIMEDLTARIRKPPIPLEVIVRASIQRISWVASKTLFTSRLNLTKRKPRKNESTKKKKRCSPNSEKTPPQKPNPVLPKPTVEPPMSPTKLYSQTAASSLPKENPRNSQSSTSTDVNLAIFKMFQDPDVKEMMQVLHKLLRISKSNKPRADKFMEIASL